MRLKTKTKAILIALAIFILLIVGYVLLSWMATREVKTNLDAQIKRVSPAFVISYRGLMVEPITRRVKINKLRVQLAGETNAQPLTIETLILELRKQAETTTHFFLEAQDLKVPVDQQMLQSPIIFQIAKEINTNGFISHLTVNYDYSVSDQQAQLQLDYALEQLGALKLKLALTHFIPGRQGFAQLSVIGLQSFELVYTDQSLVSRVFAVLAQQEGMSVPQYMTQLIQKTQTKIASETSPLVKQALEQFIVFCQNPQQLSLSATPAQPVLLGQLRLLNPEQSVDQLNLKVIASSSKGLQAAPGLLPAPTPSIAPPTASVVVPAAAPKVVAPVTAASVPNSSQSPVVHQPAVVPTKPVPTAATAKNSGAAHAA